MEEFDSPRVFRSLVPSPLRSTPSPSKEALQSFYSSPVPRFILESVENSPVKDDIIELPRHFQPNFEFRLVNGHPNPSTEQFLEVSSYFPGCSGVSYRPPFLVVLWTVMPRKPWPLTFGKLPLFYGSNSCPRPPSSYGRPGESESIFTSVEDRLEPWVHPRGRIKHILQSLIAQGIKVYYFGWTGIRWYVEVFTIADGIKLPSQICGLLVRWKVQGNSNLESARRIIMPSGGSVFDTTSYSPTSCAGVLVESAGGRGTTSGITLLARDGSRYITLAAHGFPIGDQNVYHPTYESHNLIARVHFTILGFDIALAKLEEGIKYSHTSFDGDDMNGIELDDFIHSEDMNILSSIFLDSPYNGKCEGIVIAIGFHEFSIDGAIGQFPYIECDMVYFGNGANTICLGICGSAMWTEKKRVATFFRLYFEEDGVVLAPTINALIEGGYEIYPIL